MQRLYACFSTLPFLLKDWELNSSPAFSKDHSTWILTILLYFCMESHKMLCSNKINKWCRIVYTHTFKLNIHKTDHINVNKFTASFNRKAEIRSESLLAEEIKVQIRKLVSWLTTTEVRNKRPPHISVIILKERILQIHVLYVCENKVA